MNIDALNYYYSEIKKEWEWELEADNIRAKKDRLSRAIKIMVGYDESKYPGKYKHDLYIKSDKWKIRRAGYLKHYQYSYDIIQCELCLIEDNSINWNLHHNNYANFAHKSFCIEMDDIICLCPLCHESLHLSIDVVLSNSDRKMYKEHQNKNGKFFDSDGCLKFGKYKGYSIDEVPSSYLAWVERETNSDYDLEILEHRY